MEQIHDSFPAASLKDIYGAIYYYLEHTDAVEAYMQEQRQAAAATRQWVESQPENRGLRERLLTRQPLVRDWTDTCCDCSLTKISISVSCAG